jgi:hypothetical protein
MEEKENYRVLQDFNNTEFGSHVKDDIIPLTETQAKKLPGFIKLETKPVQKNSSKKGSKEVE